MVRKLKKKEEKFKRYSDPAGYDFDDEDFDEIKFGETFTPRKPIKSDLQEVFSPGEHRKIELLTHRYELRLTELEKEIITSLKNEGINVSEELRKSLLRLNKSLVKSKIEPLYLEKLVRLEFLEKEIKELKKDIIIEKYKNYYCAKQGDGYNYSDDEEEIQEMINERYAMKYKLDDLKREYKQVRKFIDKYAEFF